MKQFSTSFLIIGCLISSSAALADNHTVSVGYAQSKIEHAHNMRGVNLQYRYENAFPVGVLVSATYMSGDDDETDFDSYGYAYEKSDTKAFLIQTGPVYRINPFASIYGTVGLSYGKVKYNYEDSSNMRIETTEKKTNFAYGAGIIINPTGNLSVNAGYEGTRLTASDDEGEREHAQVNGFNVGVGYRF